MKINYNSGVTPLVGKHAGGNFQRGNYYNNLTSLKRNGRYRYPFQFDSSGLFIKCTRAWRQLSSAQQTAWNNWAATFPQPSQKVPGLFMSGYENFVSRNFYQLLFFGRNSDLITSPVMAEVGPSTIDLTAKINSGQLLFDYSWSRTGSDILAGVFVSFTNSAGLIYPGSRPRFMGVLENAGGFEIVYGLLYNFFAVNNALDITSGGGWRPFSTYDRTLLVNYFGGYATAGGHLKVNDLAFWNSSNTGADNSSLMFRKGNGLRNAGGSFSNLNQSGFFWSNYSYSATNAYCGGLNYNTGTFGNYNHLKKEGNSVLLCRTVSGIPNGTTGSYTGNDGKVYATIVWNNREWLVDHLCETKYNDGSDIPVITDASAWSADTSGALCAYDNDLANAFSSGGGSFDSSGGFEKYFGILPASGQWILVTIIKVGKENGQFLDAQSLQLQVQ